MVSKLMVFISLTVILLTRGNAVAQDMMVAMDMGLEEELLFFSEDEMIISATKIKQDISKAPASMSVITQEEIRRSGARTLGDLLKYLPGIYITTSRNGTELIKIRGEQSRYNYRTLLIIDGIPLRELHFGYTPINEMVPLENIKRIEVIRGPGSALYGTNAFAGVINIVTINGEDADGITANVGYGGFNTKKYNIFYGKKFDNGLHFAINTRFLDSDGYNVGRGRDGELSSVSDASTVRNVDLMASYNNFTFKALHFNIDRPYPYSRKDVNKQISEHVNALGIGYKNEFSDKLEINSLIYYDQYYYNETKNGDAEEEVIDNYIVGMDNHLVFNLSENNSIVAGFATELEVAAVYTSKEKDAGEDPVLVGWIENSEGERRFGLLNYAIYLQDVWKISETMEFTAGVRHDIYELYGSSTNPRAGIVYSPSKAATIKVLYGEAFRGPIHKEVFLKDNELDNKSNPNLGPEKIKTFELETDYKFNAHMEAKLRYFNNNQTDAIQIIEIDEDTEKYDNIQGIKSQGFEVEMKYRYSKLYGFANYTFVDGEDSNGNEIGGYANTANWVVNYDPLDVLNTRLGARYLSRRNRPDKYHTDKKVVNDLVGIDNLKPYFDLELSMIYKISDKMELAGFIYNLLNDENFNPSNDEGKYWDMKHPGRSYFINLMYKL